MRAQSCMFSKTNLKFRLILGGVILPVGAGAICAAAKADDPASDPLWGCFHANSLALVEARTIVNASGNRSVLPVWPCNATDLGKLDGADLRLYGRPSTIIDRIGAAGAAEPAPGQFQPFGRWQWAAKASSHERNLELISRYR